MKIVVLDGYTLYPDKADWDRLMKLGEVTVYPRTTYGEILQRAEKAEVLLTNKTVLKKEILAALPDLKYIGVMATGYNVVDVDEATLRGITVTNVPAYSTMSVAQMVFAHLLNIAQHVGHYADEVRRGGWSRQTDFCYQNTPLVELAGKQMGIVGFGQTGEAVARLAHSFGMKVAVYSRKPQSELPDWVDKMELDEVFVFSDVVSLHCPLNEDTRYMVNESRLKRMKKGAVLINTARGGLVDEEALARALAEGHLAAAGLDVLSKEPPANDSPLLELENCFITPHIAWASAEAKLRLITGVENNLKSWIEGSPVNVVSGNL